MESLVDLPFYNPIMDEETKYPYRFMTEEEFEDRYGDDWLDTVHWNYNEMDYMYGITFPNNHRIGMYDGWTVYVNMLTDNEKNKSKKPSYTPRKFNKTFESFDKDTYQYKSVAFKIEDYETLRKIITYFHNNLKVEIVSELEWLIGDVSKNFRSYDRNMLLISFDKSLFYVMSVDELNSYVIGEFKTNPNVFTVNDLHLFSLVPNYSPRRIERTLESVTHRFPYKEIGIKIENEDELIEVQDNLRKIGLLTKDLSNDIQVYPNYLFVDVWDYEDLKKIEICYLSDDWDREESYRRLVANDPSIYQYMFSLSEWNKVESILKYGKEIVTPNYNPKKIERTLESVKNTPYERIVFVIRSEEENKMVQGVLFTKGNYWSDGESYERFRNYPQIIWVYFDTNKLSSSVYGTGDYSDNRVHNYIEEQNRYGENINPTLFKASDVRFYDIIKRTGKIEPSYEPRKTDRNI